MPAFLRADPHSIARHPPRRPARRLFGAWRRHRDARFVRGSRFVGLEAAAHARKESPQHERWLDRAVECGGLRFRVRPRGCRSARFGGGRPRRRGSRRARLGRILRSRSNTGRSRAFSCAVSHVRDGMLTGAAPSIRPQPWRFPPDAPVPRSNLPRSLNVSPPTRTLARPVSPSSANSPPLLALPSPTDVTFPESGPLPVKPDGPKPGPLALPWRKEPSTALYATSVDRRTRTIVLSASAAICKVRRFVRKRRGLLRTLMAVLPAASLRVALPQFLATPTRPAGSDGRTGCGDWRAPLAGGVALDRDCGRRRGCAPILDNPFAHRAPRDDATSPDLAVVR